MVAIEAAAAAPVVVPEVALSEYDATSLERGQYGLGGAIEVSTTGSDTFDELIASARSSGASDLYISVGVPAIMRVAGDLRGQGERTVFTAGTLSGGIGVIAPPAMRAN